MILQASPSITIKLQVLPFQEHQNADLQIQGIMILRASPLQVLPSRHITLHASPFQAALKKSMQNQIVGITTPDSIIIQGSLFQAINQVASYCDHQHSRQHTSRQKPSRQHQITGIGRTIFTRHVYSSMMPVSFIT